MRASRATVRPRACLACIVTRPILARQPSSGGRCIGANSCGAPQVELSGWAALQLAALAGSSSIGGGGPRGDGPAWLAAAAADSSSGGDPGSVNWSMQRLQSSGNRGGGGAGPAAPSWETGDEPQAGPPQRDSGSGGDGARRVADGPEVQKQQPAGQGDGRPRGQDQEQQAEQQAEQGEQQQAEQEREHDGPAVRAALALLSFYRRGLSPLMQSTCRFLPTCSQYSIDSYKRYGVWRGTVLTAWRLLRCNPWGDSGYDPTSWPPVGIAPLFAWEYSAQVAVVAGTALVLKLGHALLF
ncbi:MAG: hemolytic domain-containing protein, partial [Monoraphidium minutum]